MERVKPYLAFDIGAGSGRAFLGFIEGDGLKGKRLKIEEIHRFENKPVWLNGTLYWDFLFIWDNILRALKKCSASGFVELAGIGIDTWNCDFGLLDENGILLTNPLAYRDQGPAEIEPYLRKKIDEQELYRTTGIGFNTITALSKFVYMARCGRKWHLDVSSLYLPVADLLRYFLTGEKNAEESILWGSQLIDIRTRGWERELAELFDIPERILPEIVPVCTVTGDLAPEIKKICGIKKAPVVAVAEHDTISAAVTADIEGGQRALLSVGTWSILGKLLKKPETGKKAFEAGFLNELASGSILFAKNMMGFYVLEGLIKEWSLRDIDCSYKALIKEAASAPAFSLDIDVNDPVFFSAVSMEGTLKEYLRKKGRKPESTGKVVRSILESLALSFGEAVSSLELITGEKIDKLMILGGGVKNELLCQMTADACGINVITGPAEAAVIGNLGIQAVATGALDSVSGLHELIKTSFPGSVYSPLSEKMWNKHQKQRKGS
jgi:sugar (pentulose or hexulose) kinase